MKKASLIIIILCIAVNCRSGIILPDDNFVTGWTTSGKTLRFLGSNLFNYINGGAEIFYEFGFSELQVQSYRQKENEIVLEVYEMNSPESALGIYLMKSGNETPIEKIHTRNSGNKYQFTIVKGCCFIQINSFAGDNKLIPVMTALAQQTLKFVPKEKPVTIIDRLPKENLIPGSELIVRGPYGLQPIYTFGEGDILQLNGHVFGVIGNYKDENYGTYKTLLFKYDRKADAQSAFSNLIKNFDPYLSILEKDSVRFIFKDFQDKFGVVGLNNDTIEIKIKLKQKPELIPK